MEKVITAILTFVLTATMALAGQTGSGTIREVDVPEGDTFEAVSPSIREQSYIGAKRALCGPQQTYLRNYSKRLETALAQAYGHNPAVSRDAIGDWNDGAENSLATESVGQDYQDRRVAAALKGLHGAQKQTLLFQHHETGPHSLYHLHFATNKEDETRRLLTEAGIGMRTVYPAEAKGQPVRAHVADLGDKDTLLPGIEKLIKSGHIIEATHRRGTVELIGDQNAESRHAGAEAYRRILQEARSAWHQTHPMPGGGGAYYGTGQYQKPWWEPFEREAEQAYEKLTASQEYQRSKSIVEIWAVPNKVRAILLPRDSGLTQRPGFF